MVPLSFVEISERLKQIDLPEIDLVIGIGTGGVPPATFVAFHLNAELQVMALNYRDEKNNPQRYIQGESVQKDRAEKDRPECGAKKDRYRPYRSGQTD